MFRTCNIYHLARFHNIQDIIQALSSSYQAMYFKIKWQSKTKHHHHHNSMYFHQWSFMLFCKNLIKRTHLLASFPSSLLAADSTSYSPCSNFLFFKLRFSLHFFSNSFTLFSLSSLYFSYQCSVFSMLNPTSSKCCALAVIYRCFGSEKMIKYFSPCCCH